MVFKKALEVYLKYALVVLLEADGAEKSCVLDLSYKLCLMYAAEINEVESSSAHNKHRLKVVDAGNCCEVVDKSAFGGNSELADADKLAVHCSLISQSIRNKLSTASLCGAFLLLFCLYR